ncbi:hypothetical protein [Paraburkholderia caffeinilytica]|uniref:hypothetical protein n=1 Tax=Paraburkholderia caffeinilytica TaxID=1761016 RepID=UPI003DA17CDC
MCLLLGSKDTLSDLRQKHETPKVMHRSRVNTFHFRQHGRGIEDEDVRRPRYMVTEDTYVQSAGYICMSPFTQQPSGRLLRFDQVSDVV